MKPQLHDLSSHGKCWKCLFFEYTTDQDGSPTGARCDNKYMDIGWDETGVADGPHGKNPKNTPEEFGCIEWKRQPTRPDRPGG